MTNGTHQLPTVILNLVQDDKQRDLRRGCDDGCSVPDERDTTPDPSVPRTKFIPMKIGAREVV
jgi:hypothetical protein